MIQAECGICAHTGPHPRFSAREMMFGLGDEFWYFQCSACGCLQIEELPADLSRFYPPDYYSFGGARTSLVERATRSLRVRYAFTGRGIMGRLVARRFPYPFAEVKSWLARTGAASDSRILDVGCGSGELLRDLWDQGFTCLTGIDPYLEHDVEIDTGPMLLKRTIHEITGEFDLIMFHHVLEHVPDQVETLRAAAGLLAPGGHCLVRIPIASSHAWEHYRENWVQLDPPRHLFLHSLESIERVATAAGLRLIHVEHDSTAFQFIGSELYRRGIPLSARVRLPRRQVQRFRKQAKRLNADGRGDQAAFYFVKAR